MNVRKNSECEIKTMNLLTVSCLYFLCEIANYGILGYWAPPTKKLNYVIPKMNSKYLKEASRRQNLETTPGDASDRHRNTDRLIKMNAENFIAGQGITAAMTESIKMRGRETTRPRSIRVDEETEKPENDGSALLKLGYLDPLSLRRQLEYIIYHDYYKKRMNATLEVIGHTAEFNEIVLLKMSERVCTKKDPKHDDDDDARRKNIKYEENVAKKLVFIVHNLSPQGAGSLGYLISLRSFITVLDMYVEQLNRFDIFLIPIANPDGIGRNTLGMNKLAQYKPWYKNMSPQEYGGFGVNLDHNFDVSWKPSVENSFNQFYPGPAPFSEAETRAIRDIFFRYNHNMVAYFNVHASSIRPSIHKGDAVLFPRGYSEGPSNDDKYLDLKGDIDEALRNASLHLYSLTVDTLYNWYGKVTGKSVDYASSIYGVPYSVEICMQAYADHVETLPQIVLNEIWDRVFKVIFNSIEKSLKRNDDHMRRHFIL